MLHPSADQNGTNCWGEQYDIDNWGNLTTIQPLVGYVGCTVEMLQVLMNPSGNNQIGGFSYDASGNTLYDSHNTDAFMSTHKFFKTYVDPFHVGALVLHQSGVGVRGMEMVFPTSVNDESQAHIDYRSGFAHLGSANDDVITNEEEYRRLYGPLPGVIP